MKKIGLSAVVLAIGLSAVVLAIGCANWLIVLMNILLMLQIVTRPIILSNTQVLVTYQRFSFIPALINLIVTMKIKKEYRTVNLTINIIFLILYSFIFLFSLYVVRMYV